MSLVKDRKVWADYLRVAACLAIIVLHVITNRLDHTEVLTKNWYILSGALVLTRWALPVFIMISGGNLLGREDEFVLAKKHSIKLGIMTISWCVLYLLVDPTLSMVKGESLAAYNLEYFCNNFASGRGYHFWFCFMMLGLYLAIPLLNPIIKERKRCIYFFDDLFCYGFCFTKGWSMA